MGVHSCCCQCLPARAMCLHVCSCLFSFSVCLLHCHAAAAAACLCTVLLLLLLLNALFMSMFLLLSFSCQMVSLCLKPNVHVCQTFRCSDGEVEIELELDRNNCIAMRGKRQASAGAARGCQQCRRCYMKNIARQRWYVPRQRGMPQRTTSFIRRERRGRGEVPVLSLSVLIEKRMPRRQRHNIYAALRSTERWWRGVAAREHRTAHPPSHNVMAVRSAHNMRQVQRAPRLPFCLFFSSCLAERGKWHGAQRR